MSWSNNSVNAFYLAWSTWRIYDSGIVMSMNGTNYFSLKGIVIALGRKGSKTTTSSDGLDYVEESSNLFLLLASLSLIFFRWDSLLAWSYSRLEVWCFNLIMFTVEVLEKFAHESELYIKLIHKWRYWNHVILIGSIKIPVRMISFLYLESTLNKKFLH